LEGEPRADRWRSARKALLELPVILLIAFLLVFGLVRPMVASPFYVGSESMVPTLSV
jgi:signal peptidase I